MRIEVDSNESKIKLLPQTDIDLFRLGRVFGNNISHATACSDGKIRYVEVNFEDLWDYIFNNVSDR